MITTFSGQTPLSQNHYADPRKVQISKPGFEQTRHAQSNSDMDGYVAQAVLPKFGQITWPQDTNNQIRRAITILRRSKDDSNSVSAEEVACIRNGLNPDAFKKLHERQDTLDLMAQFWREHSPNTQATDWQRYLSSGRAVTTETEQLPYIPHPKTEPISLAMYTRMMHELVDARTQGNPNAVQPWHRELMTWVFERLESEGQGRVADYDSDHLPLPIKALLDEKDEIEAFKNLYRWLNQAHTRRLAEAEAAEQQQTQRLAEDQQAAEDRQRAAEARRSQRNATAMSGLGTFGRAVYWAAPGVPIIIHPFLAAFKKVPLSPGKAFRHAIAKNAGSYLLVYAAMTAALAGGNSAVNRGSLSAWGTNPSWTLARMWAEDGSMIKMLDSVTDPEFREKLRNNSNIPISVLSPQVGGDEVKARLIKEAGGQSDITFMAAAIIGLSGGDMSGGIRGWSENGYNEVRKAYGLRHGYDEIKDNDQYAVEVLVDLLKNCQMAAPEWAKSRFDGFQRFYGVGQGSSAQSIETLAPCLPYPYDSPEKARNVQAEIQRLIDESVKVLIQIRELQGSIPKDVLIAYVENYGYVPNRHDRRKIEVLLRQADKGNQRAQQELNDLLNPRRPKQSVIA